ncbi:hypothetical protein HCX48_12510 [Rhodocyclus tenuis]|uniref:Porin n=2 Tax=Rhodocyclus TaxID=1064 RepID=A0A6L5JXC9_RHOTE|nr:TorF family putative porin [Rhodocyclus gracilis]MQY50858.1 hypothetical protein [Rhodocyclus gracilis]MRD72832.1 hypothetical protein [Rhodocyclus gracilis]NJA90037.1 hypothetical protein [Rhodocyclus gracilis]
MLSTRRLLSSAVLLATAALSSPCVLAQSAPAADNTLTGNLGLFSNYRFRGIDQTFGKPALQGGFDYTHASGVYLGNWNSNVSSGAGYPGGNLEMDFYGGIKHSVGDVLFDVGAIYYAYPGTDATLTNNSKKNSGSIDNKELYIGASWQMLALKYSYAIDDYFSTPDTRGTSYLDASTTIDLGEGWSLNGHVGRLHARNLNDGSYTDWKLGASKEIDGWVVGAAYVDTNAKGDCGRSQPYCFSNSMNNQGAQNGSQTRDAGRATVVFSLGKSF